MASRLNGKSEAAIWPVGHSGWFFSGRSEFEGRATAFLAEGAKRKERLMLVVDDPRPRSWPNDLIERGVLIVASTAELYGAGRVVDPAQQRATFETALVEALREGFTGIRAVADNTSLTAGQDRLAAWILWEREADRFISENPFTGLCAFDRTRIDPTSMQALTGVHTVVKDSRGS